MLSTIVRCPICGSKLKEYKDCSEGVVFEEQQNCELCRLYHYQYTLGNSEVYIGGETFEWWHGDTPAEMNIVLGEIKRATKQIFLDFDI